MKLEKQVVGVDLFAGAGGMSLGAEMAGIKVVYAIEREKYAAETYKENHATEIIVTMNMREWRHFFQLRTSEHAHPQMREIACELLDEFKKIIPVIFEDIEYLK